MEPIGSGIDLGSETLVSLSQAARLLPPGRRGRPVNLSTILRWIIDGVAGVRLEGLRVGGRWLTSKEALARFAERLTPDLSTIPQRRTSRPPATRERAANRACAELAKEGI
jgi:hypothetical protein